MGRLNLNYDDDIAPLSRIIGIPVEMVVRLSIAIDLAWLANVADNMLLLMARTEHKPPNGSGPSRLEALRGLVPGSWCAREAASL